MLDNAISRVKCDLQNLDCGYIYIYFNILIIKYWRNLVVVVIRITCKVFRLSSYGGPGDCMDHRSRLECHHR